MWQIFSGQRNDQSSPANPRPETSGAMSKQAAPRFRIPSSWRAKRSQKTKVSLGLRRRKVAISACSECACSGRTTSSAIHGEFHVAGAPCPASSYAEASPVNVGRHGARLDQRRMLELRIVVAAVRIPGVSPCGGDEKARAKKRRAARKVSERKANAPPRGIARTADRSQPSTLQLSDLSNVARRSRDEQKARNAQYV